MRLLKFVIIGFGSFFLLTSLCLIFCGGLLIWVHQGLTDNEGYINAGTIDIDRSSNAVIADPFSTDESAIIPINWFGLDTITIELHSKNPSKQIFIGTATDANAKIYLNNINYDQLSWKTEFLKITRFEYLNSAGSSELAAPATKAFWGISQYGKTPLIIECAPNKTQHFIVITNEDGSAGIDLSITLYMHISMLVLVVGIILLAAGFMALIMALIIIFMTIFWKKRPSILKLLKN